MSSMLRYNQVLQVGYRNRLWLIYTRKIAVDYLVLWSCIAKHTSPQMCLQFEQTPNQKKQARLYLVHVTQLSPSTVSTFVLWEALQEQFFLLFQYYSEIWLTTARYTVSLHSCSMCWTCSSRFLCLPSKTELLIVWYVILTSVNV